MGPFEERIEALGRDLDRAVELAVDAPHRERLKAAWMLAHDALTQELSFDAMDAARCAAYTSKRLGGQDG